MRDRIFSGAPAALLVCVSTLLLAAVGWGDASRFYPRLMVERVAVVASTIAAPIAAYAEMGLPLGDFTGFQTRARAARAAAPEIEGVAIHSLAGGDLYSDLTAEGQAAAKAEATPTRFEVAGVSLRDVGETLILTQPIENRFGRVGEIEILIDRASLEREVERRLAPMAAAAPAAALAALILLAFLYVPDARRRVRRAEAVAGVSFAVFAAAMLLLVFDLYRDGATSKTDAFALAMANRLSAATEIGLDPQSFAGLDRVLDAYLADRGEISRIAVLAGGETVAAAPQGAAEGFGVSSRAVVAPMAGAPDYAVVATTPLSAMAADLWRAGRNFLVLFVACGVAGYLLIAMGGSAAGAATRSGGGASVAGGADAAAGLSRIRALYFLCVAMDSLAVSFLPGVSTEAAMAAGLPDAAGAWPFAIYFAALTLTLIPAGARASAGDLRGLLLLGAAFAAGGFGLLCFSQDFWTLMAARAVSGAGQGALLVGVQGYALASVPEAQRTRAAAVQVFAFNAGFLCGASIGGMLYDFTDAPTIFAVAAAVGGAALILAATTGAAPVRAAPTARAPSSGRIPPVSAFLGDRSFVLTLTLVGALSKFILAGVVMFGAPLMLAARGWSADTIGQLLMVFAIATLVAVPASARFSDRSGDPGRAVAGGALLSALGVLVFTAPEAAARFLGFDLGAIAGADTAAAIAGLALLGLGQGATAAPLIAEIARTDLARAHGRDTTLSVYRFAERIGHISGPAAVARLGVSAGSASVAALGLGAAGCAIVYALVRPRAGARPDNAPA